MKKLWTVLCLALITMLALAGCGGGTSSSGSNGSGDSGNGSSAQSDNEIRDRTLTFATTMEDSGIDKRIKEKFAELVEQKSGGKMRINFFMGGQLGSEKEALEQMKLGELDMGYNVVQADLYYKEYNIAMLPYLFPDYESVKRFMNGPIGEKIKKLDREKGGIPARLPRLRSKMDNKQQTIQNS
ncbi:MAG TPA: TRAP transporter substrate-binding protein DctP [Bacillales bacterium]|nr:TRAP transporter substrate-binding protein DctP [Bacillales bacterium]